MWRVEGGEGVVVAVGGRGPRSLPARACGDRAGVAAPPWLKPERASRPQWAPSSARPPRLGQINTTRCPPGAEPPAAYLLLPAAQRSLPPPALLELHGAHPLDLATRRLRTPARTPARNSRTRSALLLAGRQLTRRALFSTAPEPRIRPHTPQRPQTGPAPAPLARARPPRLSDEASSPTTPRATAAAARASDAEP